MSERDKFALKGMRRIAAKNEFNGGGGTFNPDFDAGSIDVGLKVVNVDDIGMKTFAERHPTMTFQENSIVENWGNAAGTLRTNANRVDHVDMTTNERSHVKIPISKPGDFIFDYSYENFSANNGNVAIIAGLSDTDMTSVDDPQATGNGIYCNNQWNAPAAFFQLGSVKAGVFSFSQNIMADRQLYYIRLKRVGTDAICTWYTTAADRIADTNRYSHAVVNNCTTATLTWLYLFLSKKTLAGLRISTGYIKEAVLDGVQYDLSQYAQYGPTINTDAVAGTTVATSGIQANSTTIGDDDDIQLKYSLDDGVTWLGVTGTNDWLDLDFAGGVANWYFIKAGQIAGESITIGAQGIKILVRFNSDGNTYEQVDGIKIVITGGTGSVADHFALRGARRIEYGRN